jgi:beta-phosphoglucomutase
MSRVATVSLVTKTAVQGVIFDMDGVIVDSHPSHRKAWHRFLQSVGKDVSEGELDFILDGRKRHEILRHFLGELSEGELIEYGNRKDDFFQQALSDVKPVPGVIDFVRQLKRSAIPVALATSGSKRRAQFTLRRLQLTEYFGAVITGNDVAEGKPDPAIYCVACEQLEVPAAHVVAFEDAVSGIHAARGAGLECIGVGQQEQAEKLRQAGAAHVIESFVGFAVKELEAIFGHKGARRTTA